MICGELKRVLRSDGLMFWNVADSYAANRTYQVPSSKAGNVGNSMGSKISPGLKPKDMCLVPQKVLIALQEDGWWVRNDIILYKRNAMPSSVKDRFTSCYEHMFFLAKSEDYFFDQEAVKEIAKYAGDNRGERTDSRRGTGYNSMSGITPERKNKRDVFIEEAESTPNDTGMYFFTKFQEQYPEQFEELFSNMVNELEMPRKELFEVITKGYPGAHFAVYNPDWIKPVIVGSTSERGCCTVCGKQYRRVIDKGLPLKDWMEACGADTTGEYNGESDKWLKQDAIGKQTYVGFNKRYKAKQLQNASDVKRRILAGMVEKDTRGWVPTCNCQFIHSEQIPRAYPGAIQYNHDGSVMINDFVQTMRKQIINSYDQLEVKRPIVLDPFGGSGTTAEVALKNNCDYILIELNEGFIPLMEERIRKVKEGQNENKT